MQESRVSSPITLRKRVSREFVIFRIRQEVQEQLAFQDCLFWMSIREFE